MDTIQLLERWEDRREIQNLFGKYTYSLLLKRESSVFDAFWSASDTVSLGLNNGYYVGREAIKDYYESCHQKTLLRTKLLKEDFPEEMGNLTDEEAYGAGVLNYKPLSNQIIEIAEDGDTAKGFWYVVGMYDEIGESGPLSYWTFGMFGCDFIRENGQWKLWHVLYVEDIDHPMGENWTAAPKSRPPMPQYAAMKDVSLAKPTVEISVRELYGSDRPFTPALPIPVPYKTFSDTFSYGYEGGNL